MIQPFDLNLRHLRALVSVVALRSLNRAAEAAGLSQPALTQGMAKLERQLGVLLFDREGTKKPRLTTAGEAVLAEARTVAQGIDGLRAKVKGLLDGLEAEVNLAVDVMLPTRRLGEVLRAFRAEFPTVTLRLHVEALGAITSLVLEGKAVLGISGPLAVGMNGIECEAAGSVPMVPVAAPDHPLGRMRPIPPGAGRDHVQLVLSDRPPLTAGRDFAVMSPRTWRLADLGAKHALLREGIGWGNMPLPLIEPDLVAGTLVRLAMPESPGGMYRFGAIWRRDAPPGPAAAWLRARFVAAGQGDRDLEGLGEA